MITFSDSDEITGNELVTTESTDEEETDSSELADELLAMEEDEIDGNEIKEKIEGIEDDIEMLKNEEAAAINGDMKKIEDELDMEKEKLDEAEGDLEDEVAGFVGE
ncbi:hypothetical protein H7X65_00025 [Candidatus Parcubacteria bacterium]|nr:hypothetical protein [Candidatus Parcubacteria bacterium]